MGKTSQRFGDAPTSKKRRGRSPKVREKPAEGYQSAIACHLAANADCRKSFRESDFNILCRCHSKHHQDVLEAMFIHVLRPKLCKQKSFVTNMASNFRHLADVRTVLVLSVAKEVAAPARSPTGRGAPEHRQVYARTD